MTDRVSRSYRLQTSSEIARLFLEQRRRSFARLWGLAPAHWQSLSYLHSRHPGLAGDLVPSGPLFGSFLLSVSSCLLSQFHLAQASSKVTVPSQTPFHPLSHCVWTSVRVTS